MEYWYMYINSSLVNDVTSNGEGRGGNGGGGEKALLFCDPVKMSHQRLWQKAPLKKSI